MSKRPYRIKDLTGNTYGWLVVKELSDREKIGHTFWMCDCTRCGGQATVERRALQLGNTTSCGCLKRDNAKAKIIDETHTIHGRLYVIGRAEGKTKHSNVLWRVVCLDCNHLKSVSGPDLRRSSNQTCGCAGRRDTAERNKKRAEDRRNHFGINSAMTELYGRYTGKAKHKKIPFELSWDEFFAITSSNCAYCKRPPHRVVKRHKDRYVYNGIDRVKPDKDIGYILSNSVPCCFDCNQSKNIKSLAEFKEYVAVLYQGMCASAST